MTTVHLCSVFGFLQPKGMLLHESILPTGEIASNVATQAFRFVDDHVVRRQLQVVFRNIAEVRTRPAFIPTSSQLELDIWMVEALKANTV